MLTTFLSLNMLGDKKKPFSERDSYCLNSDLLHVTTEVQIGERLLLLGIVLCSLFGFLFLLASSFFLNIWTQERICKANTSLLECSTSRCVRFLLTSTRFCRSFSRSLRILCCSARSERRFSCGISHVTTLKALYAGRDHSTRANGGVYSSKWQSGWLNDRSDSTLVCWVTFRLELIINGPTRMFSVWVTFVSMGAFLSFLCLCIW